MKANTKAEINNMHDTQKNVALIVHSCDRYELLFEGFERFFLKYWNFDIACNYYFATEEKESTIKGFKNIRSGKGEWSDRLAYLLKECITEPYVLYFQEDMWLNKPVNPLFFNQLFEIVVSEGWLQVKLHSSGIYKTVATPKFIEGFNVTLLDNAASEFLMSHQVTLWNKEFLLKQLQKKEHPWRNERKATKRLKKINPEIYHIDYFAENGGLEINNNSNPILRSEYLTISDNGTLHENVKRYIKEMEADENTQSYALKLKYNFQNNLTHDGQAKPRKVDVFKQFKNWLTR
jgi:hypothetical protein